MVNNNASYHGLSFLCDSGFGPRRQRVLENESTLASDLGADTGFATNYAMLTCYQNFTVSHL